MTRVAHILCAALLMLGLPATSQPLDQVVTSDVRTGWRLPNGDHIAALHLTIAPGWKTYWRAPGDAGIPPHFDWSGSANLAGVDIEWPTPQVFWQGGTRSIGYAEELVLPIRISPGDAARDIRLRTRIQMGVCEDICLPYEITLNATLPAGDTRRDPVITAARLNRPFSGPEAGVTRSVCAITPLSDGLEITTRIDMPPAGRSEAVVIEAGNPYIWVSEPKTRREGTSLYASARFVHMEGKPFAIDRKALRFTILGSTMAVDVQGCDPAGN